MYKIVDQVTIPWMSKYKELRLTLSDDYRAYARFWQPARPRGAVLYFHGIQSHCGWYEQSAAHLAQGGYAVLQIDRRGTGRNPQDRGHAKSVDQLIADAHTARDELLRLSGFSQYHMVGISWGGKLVTASYVSNATGVLSLSLVTPGLFPRVGVSQQQKAKIGFAMLYEPRRLFDIPLNDSELFTSCPKWKHFFRTDKNTLRQCTAGFYLASRRMDKMIATLPKQQSVPIHLFIAGDERIVDNDKTIQFIRNLHWSRCRITTYAAARHSLEFESNKGEYFDDLTGFLDENVNPNISIRQG